MHPPVGAHRKVPPDVGRGLEGHALDASRGGLETLVRILGGDARCHDVALWQHVVLLHEVDCCVCLRIAVVKPSDVRYAAQRDAHCHLELRCRKVHTCDSLGDWVLDLKPGVELEEIVVLRLHIVQILHRASADVPNVARQPLCRLFHLTEHRRVGDGRRRLLENLLKATLGRAVTSAERHCVSILIANDLNLEMPGTLAQLHHKHGRSWHLCLDHFKIDPHFLVTCTHADTLTPAPLGRLKHNRVPNAIGSGDGLLHCGHHCLFEDLVWNGTLCSELRLESSTRPRNGRHLCSLCQDVGCDFVAQHGHDRRSGANELDAVLFERSGELGVLGRVAPSRPHRIHPLTLGDVHDEVHVCIVVGIFATWHLDEVVSIPDELRVGLEVLRSGHGDELDGVFVAQLVVRPPAHGYDRLGRRHAVVGNEDFPDDALAAVRGDVAGQRFSGRCGVRAGVGGRGHRNLRTDVSRERGVMRGSKTARGHRPGRGGRCTTCARAAALHMVADGSAVSKESGTNTAAAPAARRRGGSRAGRSPRNRRAQRHLVLLHRLARVSRQGIVRRLRDITTGRTARAAARWEAAQFPGEERARGTAPNLGEADAALEFFYNN
mmetsp:Transcript_21960/g.54329  ORF Transcript_21960/g.54329 Transcript_21960/m.54329 type:complete len:606 (-) Transcript_21960:134-1951(-)